MSEIIFEVREDEADGGFTASALGYGIHTQGDTLEELRAMIKDAVHCYFDETMEVPKIIRLHFVREEIMAARSCRATVRAKGPWLKPHPARAGIQRPEGPCSLRTNS